MTIGRASETASRFRAEVIADIFFGCRLGGPICTLTGSLSVDHWYLKNG